MYSNSDPILPSDQASRYIQGLKRLALLVGLALLVVVSLFFYFDHQSRSEFAAMKQQMDLISRDFFEGVGAEATERGPNSANGNGLLETMERCFFTECPKIHYAWRLPVKESEEGQLPTRILDRYGYVRGDATYTCLAKKEHCFDQGTKGDIGMFISIDWLEPAGTRTVGGEPGRMIGVSVLIGAKRSTSP